MNDVKDTKDVKDVTDNSIDEFISKYLDISSLVSKIFSSENSFKIFSSILAGISLISLWIIRTIIFTFYSGVLSVYSIDNGYIDISSQHVFQFIQFLAILVSVLIINYILGYIWIKTYKSRFKHKKVLFFVSLLALWFVESMLLFKILGFKEGWTFYGIISTIIHMPCYQKILLFVVTTLVLFIINYPGIVFIFIHYDNKKKGISHIHNKSLSSKILYSGIFYIIMSITLIFSAYGVGRDLEEQRVDFRIIQQPITENDNYDEKYLFKNETGNKYIFYPVVFENKDIYIVSRLYKCKGKIIIDKTYQKVLEKNNVAAIYIENIYRLTTE